MTSNDELLQALSYFHYKKCPSIELRKKVPSLAPIFELIPRIKAMFTAKEILSIGKLPLVDLPQSITSAESTEEFWVYLLYFKDGAENSVFSYLSTFVLYLLSFRMTTKNLYAQIDDILESEAQRCEEDENDVVLL